MLVADLNEDVDGSLSSKAVLSRPFVKSEEENVSEEAFAQCASDE